LLYKDYRTLSFTSFFKDITGKAGYTVRLYSMSF